MPTVVLGVTGCIGAYKACEVLRELQRHDVDVHVVMTESATRFVGAMTFEALSQHPVFLDPFAPGENGEIRHIDLADRADLLLIAPATANTIGKLARGIADDALSTLYLASRAPLMIAPAMNVNMFEHPAVKENLATLKGRGATIIEPGEGYLACGWLGKGRLAEVEKIVEAAMRCLNTGAIGDDLKGHTVLVTAGPTIEDIDPVRFLSNRSSGKMGYRLAEAARDRGAHVVLVSGPTALADPAGMDVVRVRSAQDMSQAVAEHGGRADVIVMAAAVADYRPEERAEGKLKKGPGPMSIDLVRTPDILRALGEAKRGQLLVGFAAETRDLVENARRKLVEKKLDLIVANTVGGTEGGFGSDSNAAVLVGADGAEQEIALTGKRDLADRIWDRVVPMLSPAPALRSVPGPR